MQAAGNQSLSREIAAWEIEWQACFNLFICLVVLSEHRVLNQLRTVAQELKETNKNLQEEIKSLKVTWFTLLPALLLYHWVFFFHFNLFTVDGYHLYHHVTCLVTLCCCNFVTWGNLHLTWMGTGNGKSRPAPLLSLFTMITLLRR